MFRSCVVSVVDYCSGIWDFKQFDKIDKIDMIHNRAIRYFIGVHIFTPILAITCDKDWITSVHSLWVNMLRVWNHIVSMNSTSLIKIVLM